MASASPASPLSCCPVCHLRTANLIELTACFHCICSRCMQQHVELAPLDHNFAFTASHDLYACPVCLQQPSHAIARTDAAASLPLGTALTPDTESMTVHGLVVPRVAWQAVVANRADTMGTRYQRYRECFLRHNTIFIHIPKCAGTSFEQALFGISNASQHAPVTYWQTQFAAEFWQKAFKFAVVRHPYMRLISGYAYWRAGALIGQAIDQPFVYRCRTELDTLPKFVDYLLQVHRSNSWDINDIQGGDGSCPVQFRPQTWFLATQFAGDRPVLAQLDALIRFEELTTSYPSILAHLVDTASCAPVLPHTRASLHPRVLPVCFASADFRAALWEIYRDDFELLGYDPLDMHLSEPLAPLAPSDPAS